MSFLIWFLSNDDVIRRSFAVLMMVNFPVVFVIVKVFCGHFIHGIYYEACNRPSQQSHSERNEGPSNLQSSLTQILPVYKVKWVASSNIKRGAVVRSHKYRTGEPSDETWHSVKVVYSATIVNSFIGKNIGKVVLPGRRYSSSNKPDSNGSCRVGDKASRGTYSNSSGKCSVEYVIHTKFAPKED
jgi:hypothetical protein